MHVKSVTITTKHLAILTSIVRNELSQCESNLRRAEGAFRGYLPEQLLEEYGESGQSCADVIAGYRLARDRVMYILRELEN